MEIVLPYYNIHTFNKENNMTSPRIHTLPKGEHIAPMPPIKSSVRIRMCEPSTGKKATRRERICVGTRPNGSRKYIVMSHRL